MEIPYNKEQKRVLTLKSQSSSSKQGLPCPGRGHDGTLLIAKMGWTADQAHCSALG